MHLLDCDAGLDVTGFGFQNSDRHSSIRAIQKETTGTKLVVEYGAGNFVAKIRPDQLIPPPDSNDVPGD